MNDTIVLYHGGCRDGFCAAWVVNKWFKQYKFVGSEPGDKLSNIVFIPAYYGQEPPDVTRKDVIIVDFCYPLEVMMDIIEKCKSIHVLDHHKTAMPVFESIGNAIRNNEISGPKYITLTRDLKKSGAGLAWDYFFPNEPRPWLVDYVEDRDLWNKKLGGTDLVNAYISTLEFKFPTWESTNIAIDLETAMEYGAIAQEKTEQYVREVCKNVYYVDLIASDDRNALGEFNISEPKEAYDWFKSIPIVNICQVDCSEVLHKLCELNPERDFTLYWFKRADGLYQYGMRSIGDFDVSTVAKLFGGGGHKNAAGFQLPYLLEELR